MADRKLVYLSFYKIVVVVNGNVCIVELVPVADASVLLNSWTMLQWPVRYNYGYFPPELPEIVWRLIAAGEDSIDLSDQATLLEGSRFIQNGGESPIPSVISELTISNISNSDEGAYTCHSFQEVEVLLFQVRKHSYW